MKTYTDEELEALTFSIGDENGDDNDGQIVIYTGLYRWSDQTIHDEPQPQKEPEPDGEDFRGHEAAAFLQEQQAAAQRLK
jgi:hypothetical protein